MISEHQKYLKARKEILAEKEDALERLRIRYLSDCEQIMREYNLRLIRFSETGLRETSDV